MSSNKPGLLVSDFESPEAYGIYLIERALNYWREPHWDREGKREARFVVAQLSAAASWAQRVQEELD